MYTLETLLTFVFGSIYTYNIFMPTYEHMGVICKKLRAEECRHIFGGIIYLIKHFFYKLFSVYRISGMIVNEKYIFSN
jgi:hypothetical protein